MKIAILSRNVKLYSTQRLIEAGKQRGHEIIVIDPLKCFLKIEKDKPEINYEGKILKDIEAIIPRIGASVTYHGATLIRHFETQNVYSVVSSTSLIRSRDKLRSLQLLCSAGLEIPKTVYSSSLFEIDSLIDAVGGVPLVIKLLEGTQGLGVILAETRQAVHSTLDTLHGLKAKFIIQEYIKEAQGTDIRVFIVGNKVVGAMKRQAKEGEFRSNLHRGGSSTHIRLSPEEEKTAIKAAQTIGLDVAGVDMLPSKRGNLILEINSSPGLEGIENTTQHDIAGEIFDFIQEKVLKKHI
ncbi:MAG: 30S ribosomal protein S6--L-glutamate ligase [Flammeovirgaceae bacterium]